MKKGVPFCVIHTPKIEKQTNKQTVLGSRKITQIRSSTQLWHETYKRTIVKWNDSRLDVLVDVIDVFTVSTLTVTTTFLSRRWTVNRHLPAYYGQWCHDRLPLSLHEQVVMKYCSCIKKIFAVKKISQYKNFVYPIWTNSGIMLTFFYYPILYKYFSCKKLFHWWWSTFW